MLFGFRSHPRADSEVAATKKRWASNVNAGVKVCRYSHFMSSRLDKSWKVLASPSTRTADRCVDIFLREDGSFGFEEFRRDPEDMGMWTPVAYFSAQRYGSQQDAVAAARACVPWLAEVLSP